jgi:Zn-dependent M28 family amino/carboxypeptidase
MLTDTLRPRDWTRPDNLDRVAQYIAGPLTTAGARVTEQPYTAFGKYRYRNVIASFGPAGGERIIVGAHYDSYQGLPAADDNASGVAGLIELGRLLGRTKTLRLGVDLVAFTLEEPPAYRTEWMGSWVHAASLRQARVPVRAMIALEMIGYFSDAAGSQELPHPALGLFYPTTGNFIAVIGRVGEAGLVRRVKSSMRSATDLPVHSMNGPTWMPGVDFSDHRSYWAHGYPAVMVTDTAFYRNDRYHTPRDTPDTLDYRRMAKVVEAVHGAVLALGE